MSRLRTQILFVFCVSMFMLLAVMPGTVQSQHPTKYQQTGCPFATQTWSEGRELTFAEKSSAFTEVVVPTGMYADYRFGLDTSNTPPGTLLPVIVKSMAGIENGWTQYAQNGQTALSNTCDYGMMQVNASATDLFNKSPSLRSSTRGNIAAGAVVLASKWNDGVSSNNSLPVVNDRDPEYLTNWYYAISSYNGGPSLSGWKNNPNCGSTLDCGAAYNYRASRDPNSNPPTWDWTQLPPENFPYQERVLYNMQYPQYPNQALWDVNDLGLKQITSAGDYGIRPDDALFLNSDGTSRAPNLLLFRHRASSANTALPEQTIVFEYDLPADATVTIQILNAVTNGAVLATPLVSAPRKAGWNRERLLITTPIREGYAYRIRAARGSPIDPASYYEGQYVQKISTISVVLSKRLYLPIIMDTTGGSVNLLRNGAFNDIAPGTDNQPDDWEIQNIFGPGVIAEQKVSVIGEPGSPNRFLRLLAASEGRAEVRQRFTVPAPGIYRLSYDLKIDGIPSESRSRLLVRYRSITGDAWIGLNSFGTAENGSYVAYSHDLFISAPAVLSFLATFDTADNSSEFSLARVTLIPVN